MSANKIRVWAAVTGALLLVAAGGMAAADDAQPKEDERCVAQCDAKSDKCMADAGGDERKQRRCDDEYEECLAQCR